MSLKSRHRYILSRIHRLLPGHWLLLAVFLTGINPATAQTERYPPPAMSLRTVPEARVKSMRSDPAFAYANDPAYWNEAPPPPPSHLFDFLRSPVTRWVFYIGFGGLLFYGLARLMIENFSGVWTRRSRYTAPSTGPEAGPETAGDLEAAFAAAVAAGNLSLAVRYRYLRLIRLLQDKQLVPEGKLATNRAWSAVFADKEQARRFRSLASAYEYVVYGGFVPSPGQFDLLRRQFATFEENLGS